MANPRIKQILQWIGFAVFGSLAIGTLTGMLILGYHMRSGSPHSFGISLPSVIVMVLLALMLAAFVYISYRIYRLEINSASQVAGMSLGLVQTVRWISLGIFAFLAINFIISLLRLPFMSDEIKRLERIVLENAPFGYYFMILLLNHIGFACLFGYVSYRLYKIPIRTAA